jgi:hypothetical protein
MAKLKLLTGQPEQGADLYPKARRVLRVCYEGLDNSLDAQRNERNWPQGRFIPPLGTLDQHYLVEGKIVHHFGKVKGGDHWKEQLRRDLARAYPALNP